MRQITLWVAVTLIVGCHTERICNINCDMDMESLKYSSTVRKAANVTVSSSTLTLNILDELKMAYGTIQNPEPGDTIWLERSFDGAFTTKEEILGQTNLNSTGPFNIDNPSKLKTGAVRLCGKIRNSPAAICTSWTRSEADSPWPIDAAASGLMEFYTEKGTWRTTGWWNSANALRSIIQYMKKTRTNKYEYAIKNTFELNQRNNFTNTFVDDTLWWGLAWIEAYDFTNDVRYLEMAEFDANYAEKYIDSVCNGGIWWTVQKTYKNAVTSELFIQLSAALHNRIPGDTKYLQLATNMWKWFKSSGLINKDNLINDGLVDCKNNEGIVWTYNQGIILGALVELNKATGEKEYLDEAVKIADAVLSNKELNPKGILKEYGCSAISGCDPDQISFKGIFVRNLDRLDRALENGPYRNWLKAQADSNYNMNRNSTVMGFDYYGVNWEGPFDKADAARQQSALDAFNAACDKH